MPRNRLFYSNEKTISINNFEIRNKALSLEEYL